MRIIEWSERNTVRDGDVPHSLGIIMDGNRRWGTARGIDPAESHLHMTPAIVSCIQEAKWLGIKHVMVFALSTKNMSRPTAEVNLLQDPRRWLWTRPVISCLEDCGAQLLVVGEDADKFPNFSPPPLRKASNQSYNFMVTFAVNYSSKREIMKASNRRLSTELPQMQDPLEDLGSLDLLIRTGGEKRLSDFALWQLSDAELLFTDTLWPDFRGLHLTSAVSEYQNRVRRLGT